MLPNQNILSQLGASSNECYTLSQLISSAYHGRYDPGELQAALTKHQDSLSNPLKHAVRNEQTKQYIEQNRRQHALNVDGVPRQLQLSDTDLNLIDEFSKYTNLNQRFVVAYLFDARLQFEAERKQREQEHQHSAFLNQPMQTSNELKTVVKYMKNAYFNARKMRLRVVRELMVLYEALNPCNDDNKMQQDEDGVHSEELKKIVNGVMKHIFSQNLISNLCASIQEAIRYDNMTFAEEYHTEICECMNIFYAISQPIQTNPADILSLLNLFEKIMRSKWRFGRSHRIQACCYLLSLSLYNMLDPSGHRDLINPRNESQLAKNRVFDSDDQLTAKLNSLIQGLESKGRDAQRSSKAQKCAASFGLLVIIMLRKVKQKVTQTTTQQHENSKYFKKALQHGAWVGLKQDFLLNDCLLEEFSALKTSIFKTLADFFCELFELCYKEIRDFYASSSGLTTMLHVLIFLAHRSVDFCRIFISSNSGQTLIAFLDSSADLPTPWFHLYARFVYELARSEPLLVYQQFITEKCEKLTVDAIWQILAKTVGIYTPKRRTVSSQSLMQNENMNASNLFSPYSLAMGNQSMMSGLNDFQMVSVWEETPDMTDQEVRIVTSVLKVLEALACIVEVQQMINHQHRVIMLLFKLLKCTVPSKVMSHAISCLAAFSVQSTNTADTVWFRLEEDQVLYTQRQKNQPITRGVELDIIEGEKDGNDAVYPSTIAFCRLLKNLLNTTAIPQSLGQGMRGQRPPGIHPYTDYVRDFVFLRWSKREYKREQEQWELAATCLEIFDALLDKFNPSDLKPNLNIRYLFTVHPSFELLTLLLAPHSNLVEVILEIFQKAFDSSERASLSDDTMEFVQSALKNSLKLIHKAIRQEEGFLNVCQKYWPQRLSLRPLNTTLLSQQYREQIISLAKCVEYGNDMYVASYSLSILTHLNKTQQGITLRSVSVDRIYILQNSFSTQLMNPPQIASELPDIRVSIVQFLLKSLKVSGHNLGLMLLAFSEQSASRDQLQSQISCLNAILKVSLDPKFCVDSPGFAECCFELLYQLLSNGRVWQRFLSAAETVCSSYFVTLLRWNIACALNNREMADKAMISCFLFQRAWLLRSFYLVDAFSISEILDTPDIQYLGFIQDPNIDYTDCALWVIFQQLDLDVGPDTEIDHVPHIWGLALDQFKTYAGQHHEGTYTWNINKLNAALQRAPGSQTARDKQHEIHQICQDALNHNSKVSLMRALNKAYDAWAELVRCVLSRQLCRREEMNNQLLLKLLDQILERLSRPTYSAAQWGRIANTLSQVALAIMHFFRESLGHEYPVQIAINGCKTILDGMVSAILVQRNVRNPRANLYSCLSNYLHYSRFKVPNVLSDADESKAINLNEKVTTEKDKLTLSNVMGLLSRREELLKILFHDAVCKDAYLSSISSLVLQDLLSTYYDVSLEGLNVLPPKTWLKMLLEHSELAHILKAACDLDGHIQNALTSQRHWYFLYQFESMLEILINASVFSEGSVQLIENNCISQHLAELKCLTSRVFWTAYSLSSQQQPALSQPDAVNPGSDNLSIECSRYLQVFTPCLRLINSMFAACPKNIRLHYQTLTFFQKHNDIINKFLTLDNNEVVVLKCVKLILSAWYQLYCGPLYVNRMSSVPARDSTILEHIESKTPIFFYLIKKFKTITFKSDIQSDLDNDFGIGNTNVSALYNEAANDECKEIVRILINIFRIKSIGSSLNSSVSSSELKFHKVFTKDLTSHDRINDQAPNLRLLCDCLIGILPISKQTGKWITEQNEKLRRIPTGNNSAMLGKLQEIDPMISTVSASVNLQCFLIENILLLLYFHCEFYLKSFEKDFYHQFNAVVMCEMIEELKQWYDDEQTCILHVNQDMIQKKWSSGVSIPKSTTLFVEIIVQKFYHLQRDHKQALPIEQ